jgi:hydrogenase maturation protease
VLDLAVADLAALRRPGTSTHGLSTAFACALAQQLWPGRSPPVRIVAVTIGPPEPHQPGLSPAVALAVPLAVARVLAAVESA